MKFGRKIAAFVLLVGILLLLGGGVAQAACRRAGESCGQKVVPGPGSGVIDLGVCCVGLSCDSNKCVPVFGEVTQPYGPGGYGPEDLGVFLSYVVSAISVVAGILLFFYLVFGGFRYMMAGGDEKAVMAAKNMITNAGIGMVIIATAWFIAKVLEVVLGIKILSTDFVGP